MVYLHAVDQSHGGWEAYCSTCSYQRLSRVQMPNNLGAKVWERFQKRYQDECQLRTTYFIASVLNGNVFSIHTDILVKMHLNSHSRGCWMREDTQLGLELCVFDSVPNHTLFELKGPRTECSFPVCVPGCFSFTLG